MRKQFNHCLVEPINLTTETIEGMRHYVLPSGEKFKSVTSVLSEKLDKTALFAWRKRVGEAEANRISTQAARRGTSVHSIAERYILNDENYVGKEMPSNAAAFKPISEILNSHVDNIKGVELALFSRALKTAGRTDLVCEWKGTNSILDFKTSRKLKKEEWIESYFLQSTVYSMMFEHLYKISTPQIVILIAVDHEDPQIFVRDRNQYVKKVLEIFQTCR